MKVSAVPTDEFGDHKRNIVAADKMLEMEKNSIASIEQCVFDVNDFNREALIRWCDLAKQQNAQGMSLPWKILADFLDDEEKTAIAIKVHLFNQYLEEVTNGKIVSIPDELTPTQAIKVATVETHKAAAATSGIYRRRRRNAAA